jgi:ribosomal protein L34E
MVDTGKRAMKKKTRKTPSGNTTKYFREETAKKVCAITKKPLLGVQHSQKKTKKNSKTSKRPSVPFGGILSSTAREKVFIELAKVVSGEKEINDVDQKYRKFVSQAMKRAE